jgi:ketosteroid isomerase-like protein
MRSLMLILALAANACASARPALAPAPVIAAERAFAARAGEIGWIPAFREFVAPDGQLYGQTGLVSAPQRLAALTDDGERSLYWAPIFAGIARSGDLGFTTGPASFDAERTPAMHYFTVWRRQGDGAWRWIYDGGVGPVENPGPYLAEGVAPQALPMADGGAGSAARAIAEITTIERDAATLSGLRTYLAVDAHVYRSGQRRAFGGAEVSALMFYPGGDASVRGLRAEASAAGDLVFTLGAATWRENGAAREGLAARIWQRRRAGWRIVYDQLAVRAAPPA